MINQRDKLRRLLWLTVACTGAIGNALAFAVRDGRIVKLLVLGLCSLIVFGVFPLLRAKMHIVLAALLTLALYSLEMAYGIVALGMR